MRNYNILLFLRLTKERPKLPCLGFFFPQMRRLVPLSHKVKGSMKHWKGYSGDDASLSILPVSPGGLSHWLSWDHVPVSANHSCQRVDHRLFTPHSLKPEVETPLPKPGGRESVGVRFCPKGNGVAMPEEGTTDAEGQKQHHNHRKHLLCKLLGMC